jgi:hypothetical protein
MKYLIMLQGSQADYDAMNGTASTDRPAWSREDLQAMFTFMGDVSRELSEAGELLDAQGLTEPVWARHVGALPDGRTAVTDDPYEVDRLVLAGYWLVDCEGLERATEIAARVTRCPAPEGAPTVPVVIRPVQEAPEAGR